MIKVMDESWTDVTKDKEYNIVDGLFTDDVGDEREASTFSWKEVDHTATELNLMKKVDNLTKMVDTLTNEIKELKELVW